MFKNRKDAGLQLAENLDHYKDRPGVLVLALPRGGAVTGFEIAHALEAAFDVLIVRKIGFPGQPEFAIGALSETGAVALNEDAISSGGVSKNYIENEIAVQKEEIERRIKLYKGGKRLEKLDGKTIILVDDGVATGATLMAAILTVRKEKPERLVAAVPVSPRETAEALKAMVDEFVCRHISTHFMAVGNYYRDFSQTTDEEVTEILRESVGLKRGGQI